jgi:hypothetical protein
MDEIKNCPNCKCNDCAVMTANALSRTWVYCPKCSMSGPLALHDEAIAAWNNLPRRNDAPAPAKMADDLAAIVTLIDAAHRFAECERFDLAQVSLSTAIARTLVAICESMDKRGELPY